jgi:gluconolactonase
MMKIFGRVLSASLLMLTACSFASAQNPDGTWVTKLDPALDALISTDAKVEDVKVDYFGRTEGPVWVRTTNGRGYLLVPEVAGNIVYKWEPTCAKYPCPPTEGNLSVYMRNASFTGKDLSDVGVITYNGRLWVLHGGPIGLALDPEQRLLVTQFGDRAIMREEKDGTRTVMADHIDGKRTSCPDDVLAKSDGTIYFTDGPTTCLRNGPNDPSREITYPGLYMIKDGKTTLLDKTNPGINGLALSPDEKILYVTGTHDTLLKYDVNADDTVSNLRPFVDMLKDAGITQIKRGTADAIFPDGVRIDEKGDIWTGGPGGVWIISPEGKHLGTIAAPNNPDLLAQQIYCSYAFGDDGKTFYITGNSDLRRIRVKVCGRSGPPFTCSAK